MGKLLIGMLFVFLSSICFSQTYIFTHFPHVKRISLLTGVTLEYSEKGNEQDQAVIFLHGYTDSRLSFQNVLNLLPDNVHGIAISQRGHGDSHKPKTGYTTKDLSDDLAAFISQRKIQKPIIVGHSMGGGVTLQFAIDYPDVAKAIVIIGSDAAFNDNPGLPEFVDEINKLKDPVPYEFALGFQSGTIYNKIDSSILNLYVSETMKLKSSIWQSLAKGLMNSDHTGDLKNIRIPVLIVWGDKDLICPRVDQYEMKNEMPFAELVVYENVGHAVHWEVPERFTSDLISFIKQLR